MHLESLQTQWEQLDSKLQQTIGLQQDLLRRWQLQPHQRRLNTLAVWPLIDVVACAIVIVLLMTFLGSFTVKFNFLAPALVTLVASVALLAASIDQLRRIAKLDWSGPLAAIQIELQQLRIARIRQFKWVILLSPLIGFCGFLTTIQALLTCLSQNRAPFIDQLDTAWVVSNYIFGLLFIPVGYGLAHYWSSRFQSKSWWQRLLDDIAGHSVQQALGETQRWLQLKGEY